MAEDPKRDHAVLPTAAGAPLPASIPPAMPTAAGVPLPPSMPPAMPTAAGMPLPASIPPAMPTAAGVPLPTSMPPAMPSTVSDSNVLATVVGDSRTASDGAPLAPPSMPPARYVLGTEIARGGMGRVVEATDTYLGRVVALKEALATDAESLERFARETRITARLEHPSIVPVHDGGKGANGMPYYVMRKIEGRPLEQLVMQANDLNDRLRLLRHMIASAEAIAHAHERGIVHRDIKPSNILVGELGETIVIDWGLAKVIGEADEPSEILGVQLQPVADGDTLRTRAGIVFGTPGFMAPEQLRGGPVDPRWDVYALGATLYHLLSRKPPHHAKTADEMMRAAVNAQATPIGELVAGVPPELSTIIDKALAFDPTQRYQDARELAADLERFLDGQLVASHHYSPWERVQHYVQQHRVAFLVGAVAAAAMMVGGAIAFVRIMHERDRADDSAVIARKAQQVAEAERATAELRAEELALSSARAVATTNPTYAVALLKPLVDKRWREVRAIAAEARAAGVAWSAPLSASTHSLHLSKDGTRVLSAGEDGVIRVTDLANRTTQKLGELKRPVTATFAANDTKIVVWSGLDIGVMELPSGALTQHTLDIPIASLEAVGDSVIWNDGNGELWQLDLAGGEPRRIVGREPIIRFRASPDGRWLALAGNEHFMLLDRSATAGPVELFAGTPHALDWSADSTRLGVLSDGDALEITVGDAPPRVERTEVGERTHVVHGAKGLYTIGSGGVAIVKGRESRPRKQLSKPIGMEEARGGAIIAGGEDQLLVLTDHGDLALAAPVGTFAMLRASPASPYVVATVDDRLLVWNLDEIEPRVIAPDIASALFVTSDALIATPSDGPAQWFDLRARTARDLGRMPSLLETTTSPDGARVVTLDLAHRAKLLAGDQAPVALGTADHVAFVSNEQLVLSLDEGTLERYTLGSGERTTLYTHPDGAPLASVDVRGGHAAALFVDASLWRAQITSGTITTARAAQRPSSDLRLADTGDAFVALGAELMRWPVAASALVHHTTLPEPIARLGMLGNGQVVAIANDGTAYAVDATAADRFVDLGITISRTADAPATTSPQLAVVDRGAIHIVEPGPGQTPLRWRLAAATAVAYSGVQIAPAGHRVLARTQLSELVVWELPQPASAAEVTTWLEQMTNAVAGSGAKSLGWR